MARVDSRKRQIQAKLVYYGPGLCGKTTNLEYLSRKVASDQEMMSLATEGDRTIFFDFFPLELGKIRGMDTSFKLYTVPGQVRYNQTRQMVLKNVDGIIFVADSQPAMMDANLESLDNLFSNLAELRIKQETISLILQYNKRDLPDVLPPEALDEALNSAGHPRVLASAVTGEGVVDTLKRACTMVIRRLSDSFGEAPQANGLRGTSERVSAAMPGSSKQPTAPQPAAATRTQTPAQRKQRPKTPRPSPRSSPRETTEYASKKHGNVSARSRQRSTTATPAMGQPVSHAALDALATSVTSTLEQHRAALADFMEKRVAADKSLSAELERIKELTGDLPSKSDVAAIRNAVEKLGDAEQTRMALLKVDLKKHRLQQAHLEDLCEGLGDKLTGAVPAGGAIDVSGLPSKRDFKTLGDTLGEKLDELVTKASASSGAAIDVQVLRSEIGSVLAEATSDVPRRTDLEALQAQVARLTEQMDNASAAQLSTEELDKRMSTLGEHIDRQLDELRDQTIAAIRDIAAIAAAPAVVTAEQAPEAEAEAPEPEAPEPAAPEPEATEAEAPEPEATEPEAPEPEATEAEAPEPEATEPEAPEPAAPEPEAPEPEAPEPEATEAEAPEPEPEATEPEATEAEAPEPEAEATEPEAQSAAEDKSAAEEDDELAGDPQHQNAARIARVMISDLYLYHKQEVDDGIRNGDFFERNKEALDDMRSTYDSRLDEDVRARKDHLGPAIENFIARKRKTLGLE